MRGLPAEGVGAPRRRAPHENEANEADSAHDFERAIEEGAHQSFILSIWRRS